MSRRCFGKLLNDQAGGITIFVLLLTVMLLVVGGMAVDYQRYEQARADLQNALDRGVLAATNKNQLYDPDGSTTVDEQAQELIGEYFASRNYHASSMNLTANVTEETGGRAITASAHHPLETIFLRLIGIDTLNVAATSGAIQGTPNLEISLVLDVSGSMGWDSTSAPGTKLAQLKVAAKDFLDTVLSDENEAQTLISIIPFSQQVNLPRAMADVFNLNRHHDYSSCFDFHSLDFDTTAMQTAPTTAYEQGQHFKEYSGHYGCPQANNAVTPFSDNLANLKTAIDSLATETWTATYMGMKWGSALLDPSSRNVVDAMIANGDLSSEFAGWPHGWNDPNARKIIVLMSDGQNTRLNEIHDSDYYAHTPSYWNTHTPTGSEKYSVINSEATGQGDVILKQICDATKTASNVTVYTIGFELAGEPVATAALEDCTSSLSTHYLVDGVEISTAFQNIADEIVNLKLTN